MKRCLLAMMTILLAINASAQQTTVLPDVQKPHQIAVDGNDLYIFDEADYSLHVYTISPFALKWKVGRKGDGPHDFKYLPFVYVRPESLAVTDFTKIVWLSKKGEALKATEFSDLKDFDLNSEMLLIPLKESFVRITADHGQHKRHVYLLDSGFKTIKELYEGPFTWETSAPVHYRTDTICSQGPIFVSDTLKGFFITVFDDRGNLLRTMDLNRDVEEVPGRPRLHQYCVSDGKIYAATNFNNNDGREMIILDLNGRILRRLFLPLASIRPERGVLRYDLYTVDQDVLYELIQNRETETWELQVTDLAQIR